MSHFIDPDVKLSHTCRESNDGRRRRVTAENNLIFLLLDINMLRNIQCLENCRNLHTYEKETKFEFKFETKYSFYVSSIAPKLWGRMKLTQRREWSEFPGARNKGDYCVFESVQPSNKALP